jgi:SH3 domain protein
MKRLTVILLMSLCFLFPSLTVHAENAYVTDSVEITIRSGPANDYDVVGSLYSGQPVEILSRRGNWTKIRPLTAEYNKEGWIQNKFLVSRTPWVYRAKELSQENKVLQEKLVVAEQKLKTASKQKRILERELKSIDKDQPKSETEEPTKETKEAPDYKKVQTQLQGLKRDLLKLTQQNRQLKISKNLQWLLIGFGVLLVGFIVGRFFRRRKRRKTSGGYTMPF